jgi:replicative DNA helicase
MRALPRVQALPKQPPHSTEAEQSVLGGLMLSNRIFFELADKIRAEDFYRADHQLIYRGIGAMLGANKTVDFVTLTEYFREREQLQEVGGASYLGSLAADTYSIANVIAYAEIIRERAVLRGLIGVGADIGDMGYRPDGRQPDELLDQADAKIAALRGRKETETQTAGPLLDAVGRRIERLRHKKPGEYAGLAMGFTELDWRTQGLEPGDLVIVAARPGLGKTAFAMSVAQDVAVERKIPVAVFSMEMSGEQLMQRVVSSFARIELQKLRSGQLSDADFDRMTTMDAMIREAPLFIDAAPALSPLELRSRARRLVTKHGVKLIVVDYLQLMQVPGSTENRTNVISEISRSLKALAMELKVPVIALSQLSRAVEARDNKRPRLADLRESGGIEQDADIVLFIYRDEFYNEQSTAKGEAEIIIGKQRQGPTGIAHLSFLGQYCKFDNAADRSFGV